MSEFFWNLFFILFVLGFIGTLAVIPYSLQLNPGALEALRAKMAESKKPLPPYLVIILSSSVQGVILSAVAVFLGLLASEQVGLGLPIFTALAAGEPVGADLLTFVPTAILAGALGGVILMVLEYFIFYPRLPKPLKENEKQSALWKRALACFYGGFVEEILMRLFVMAGIAWLISLVWKAASPAETTVILWIANILAALLFGAGHLPATAQMTKLTPLVLVRAFLLNGLCGLVFGWLFMRFGLESAIVAHFTADIVIHILWPELMKKKVMPVAETA